MAVTIKRINELPIGTPNTDSPVMFGIGNDIFRIDFNLLKGLINEDFIDDLSFPVVETNITHTIGASINPLDSVNLTITAGQIAFIRFNVIDENNVLWRDTYLIPLGAGVYNTLGGAISYDNLIRVDRKATAVSIGDANTVTYTVATLDEINNSATPFDFSDTDLIYFVVLDGVLFRFIGTAGLYGLNDLQIDLNDLQAVQEQTDNVINKSEVFAYKVNDQTIGEILNQVNTATAIDVKDPSSSLIKANFTDLTVTPVVTTTKIYKIITNPQSGNNVITTGLIGQGQQQLVADNLQLIDFQNSNAQDIADDPDNTVVDLGDIGATAIDDQINALGTLLTIADSATTVTLINAVSNGNNVSYIYVGSGGTFGSGQPDTITMADLSLVEQESQPEPLVQPTKTSDLNNDGENTENPFVFYKEQNVSSGGNYNDFNTQGNVIIFNNTNAQAIVTGFTNTPFKKIQVVNNSDFELRFNNEDANSSATNQIKLPTGLASIGIQGTCELVYVEDIQKWQITDAFASKYRPEHRGLSSQQVEVVNPDATSETKEIIELIVFRDAQSTAMKKAELNTAYPDAKRGFQVVCKQINTIYIKVDDNSDDWKPIFLEIPNGSITEAKLNTLLADKINQISNTVESINAGEGGKIYDTLADAQAESPKPSDGTIFTVSEITDPNNAGIYSFQSAETGGTRFERDFDFIPKYLDRFTYNEKYIFDKNENFSTNGFVRPAGTTSTNSGYKMSDNLNCKNAKKLYITSRVASTSVSPAVFYDKDDNYISGYTALDTELTTHEIDVPLNASYFITSLPNSSINDDFKIEWDVDIASSFFANPVNNIEPKDKVYVSNTGNDNNTGTKLEPFLTITKAYENVLPNGEIILLEGDYQNLQIPDISGVKLKGEGNVRLLNNRQTITDASLEPGYTKVYKTISPTSLHSNVVNLWQHDIPDSNTLIDIKDRHKWHKNKTHRLNSSKIIPASSIQDIEDSSELKYFESGGYVYFSKVNGSNLSDNPIVEPSNLMEDFAYGDLDFENINILYTVIHFPLSTLKNKLKFKDCSFLYSNTSLLYIGGKCKAEIIDCETAGSGNDGVGIHGEAYVIETRLWSHDNEDEGSSAHGISEVERKDCLYEENSSSDIMDVNSSKTKMINCIGKSLTTFGASFGDVGGSNYGNQTIINCISYGSLQNNDVNRVKAYNTLLIGVSSIMPSSIDDFNTIQVNN